MPEAIKELVSSETKKGNAKSILLSMLIIILCGGIIFGGISYSLASKSVLPEPPEKFTPESELYNKVAKGIISGGKTTIDTDDLNGFLNLAKNSINGEFEKKNSDIFINSLYGSFKDSCVICYADIQKGKKSYGITFTAEVDFTYPNAYIYISEVKIGKLKIPAKWFTNFTSKCALPKNLTVKGRRLVYNTSDLNQKLIEIIQGNQTVNDTADLIDNIFSFFGVKVEANKILDNFLNDRIDFKLTNMKIEGNKLKIDSNLFK